MDKDCRAACAAALNIQRRQMVEECRGQLQLLQQQQQLGERGGLGADSPQGEAAADPTTLIGDAEGDLVDAFEARWQLAMITLLSTAASEQPRGVAM